MSNFIPSWHFTNPSDKLKPEWCSEVINYCYYNANNKSLLHTKEIDEIEEYSSGSYSMLPYKMMFKSFKKAFATQHPDLVARHKNIHDSDMQFIPTPLIPSKLNSAVATVQKIPLEITCTALDALAAEKKKEDIIFLQNKPKLEADIQGIADQLNIGKVDLGTTKHSSVPFSSDPYGLDLLESDELDVFVNLLYNLSVETSFETALQIYYEIKKGNQIKLLEIKDQFKFGVSVNRGFESSMTGLPDVEYVYPSVVYAPDSSLPDFSDNTHRFIEDRKTAMEIFNYFSEEICDEDSLDTILNDKTNGYCACNNLNNVDKRNWGGFKLNLIDFEVKSVDSVGVATKKMNGKTFSYLTNDDKESDTCTHRIWSQNTYSFFWLRNTKHFFGIHKLGFSHRTKGLESYQNFSTNIYRSQEKSAVELSVGENKKYQIADMKLMYSVIMSLPAGKYINLKYLRGALEGLVEENDKYTMDDLLTLAFERNQIIGDTEGFDGKNDGQLKPFEDIPGGLRSEILGYMQVKAEAKRNISEYTGINDSLTGFSPNADTLVGLEKLKISASLNALYYVNEAIESQEQQLFNLWASIIKSAIEKGGATKKAIVSIIGSQKVSIIDDLDDVPLHDIGVKISIKQREEERQEFRNEITRLKLAGVITTSDEYMLNAITNPKDKFRFLAIKEKQWEKKQNKIRQEGYAQQQTLVQQQGQNVLQQQQSETQGNKEEIFAKGEVDAKILTLANQLGISSKQLDAIVKKNLQQDRAQSQLNKAVKTIEAKSESQNQQALPI